MDYKIITLSDQMWSKVRDYAKSCSWNAGKSLADTMDNNLFAEWERVIIAIDYQRICGYCTVAKTDCIQIPGYALLPVPCLLVSLNGFNIANTK